MRRKRNVTSAACDGDWPVARLPIVLSAVVLLGACGTTPVRQSKVEAVYPAKAAQIVVGQTSRDNVRQLLGPPWLTGANAAFDVFRSSDVNSELGIIFVPVMYASDEVTGYLLATYDPSGTVAGYSVGIAHSGSMALGTAEQAVAIRAGSVQFVASADGATEMLSMGPPLLRVGEYLRDHPATGCRVVVTTAGVPVDVTVDDGRHVVLPAFSDKLAFLAGGAFKRDLLPAAAIFDVSPGNHRLRVESFELRVGFEQAQQFGCSSGEVLYATVYLESRPATTSWGGLRVKLPVEVTVAMVMPEGVGDHGVVVWADGKWLVPEAGGQ